MNNVWSTLIIGENLKIGDDVKYSYHDNMRGEVESQGGVVAVNYTTGGSSVVLVADDSDCTVRLALSASKMEI